MWARHLNKPVTTTPTPTPGCTKTQLSLVFDIFSVFLQGRKKINSIVSEEGLNRGIDGEITEDRNGVARRRRRFFSPHCAAFSGVLVSQSGEKNIYN